MCDFIRPLNDAELERELKLAPWEEQADRETSDPVMWQRILESLRR